MLIDPFWAKNFERLQSESHMKQAVIWVPVGFLRLSLLAAALHYSVSIEGKHRLRLWIVPMGLGLSVSIWGEHRIKVVFMHAYIQLGGMETWLAISRPSICNLHSYWHQSGFWGDQIWAWRTGLFEAWPEAEFQMMLPLCWDTLEEAQLQSCALQATSSSPLLEQACWACLMYSRPVDGLLLWPLSLWQLPSHIIACCCWSVLLFPSHFLEYESLSWAEIVCQEPRESVL